MKVQLNDGEKLEKLNGLNYKRWSFKMECLLTIAKVFYVLTDPYPGEPSESNEDSAEKVKKWKADDFMCRFTILQSLNNTLFNVFHIHKTDVELWNAIKRRYVNEYAGNKSFLVNKYIEFKMVDTRNVIDQVNELNNIATECADAGEPISETFQVSTIIGKLPPSWKDYQKKLKHKKNSISLDELLQGIQIETESLKRDGTFSLKNDGVNQVENLPESSKRNQGKINKKKFLNFNRNRIGKKINIFPNSTTA
ncbi:uncharacterized protein [Primulina eburnea]|uniref:uncharacterized protein n=1 Tax=Primulina eburnea TaxID=1245227 RepID=UPI003C6BEC0A